MIGEVLAGRRTPLGAAVIAALALLAGTAVAAFPEDAPNDPAYDPAEEPGVCGTRSGDAQQHYLFSFIPFARARLG